MPHLPRPPLIPDPAVGGSSTGTGRRARAIARRSLIRSLTLVLGFAVVYLTARILAGTGDDGGTVGRGLLLAALIAAGAALWTARSVDDAAHRRGWRLVCLGSLAWAAGHLARTGTDLTSVVAFSAAYATMIAALSAGALVIGNFALRTGDWRRIAGEVLPPAIATLVGIWLVELGPAVAAGGLSDRLRAAAVLHGVLAAVAMVVGLCGFASRRGKAENPATVSLLVGIAIVAAGDLLWLQHRIDRPAGSSAVADATFCIGFAMVAVAALQARTAAVLRLPSQTVVSPRLTGQATELSLMALLGLAAIQIRWGEPAPAGIETTIAAGAVVVLSALTRETVARRREQALAAEVDALSSRIDALILQVGRDPLTGLANHRSAHERLEHELATGRANGTSVALALIDVDDFKSINDTLGHPIGDQVLQAVASVLTAACRVGDVAARYAGDEFLLILPGVDEEAAGRVCARVVAAVRELNRQLPLDGRVTVTLSVGAAVSHRCRRSAAQAVAIADAAMYDAKEGGKDRFVVVDADTLTTATFWGVQPEETAVPSRRGDDARGAALAS